MDYILVADSKFSWWAVFVVTNFDFHENSEVLYRTILPYRQLFEEDFMRDVTFKQATAHNQKYLNVVLKHI